MILKMTVPPTTPLATIQFAAWLMGCEYQDNADGVATFVPRPAPSPPPEQKPLESK